MVEYMVQVDRVYGSFKITANFMTWWKYKINAVSKFSLTNFRQILVETDIILHMYICKTD